MAKQKYLYAKWEITDEVTDKFGKIDYESAKIIVGGGTTLELERGDYLEVEPGEFIILEEEVLPPAPVIDEPQFVPTGERRQARQGEYFNWNSPGNPVEIGIWDVQGIPESTGIYDIYRKVEADEVDDFGCLDDDDLYEEEDCEDEENYDLEEGGC